MKNLRLKNLIIITILTTASSCKKNFLDVPVKNTVFRQEYVKDISTTGDYLNGVYIQLATIATYTGSNYPEVIADNVKPIIGSGWMEVLYAWNQQANDSKPGGGIEAGGVNANGLWLNGINMARSCSFVLESADKYGNQNTQLSENLKGQAHALRALIHFMMVNVFAQSYSFTSDGSHPGIPYVTSSDWTNPSERLSVSKVYEKMIEDLNAAIKLLPAQQTAPSGFKYSLLNKTAAKALLARIYFFKNDWALAKNLACEVANTVPIMTGSNNYPSKLFTNNETEAIFQLPPSDASGKGAGNYSTFFGAMLYSSPSLGLLSTNDMANILQEKSQDIRNSWVKKNGANWEIKKFPSGVISGFSTPTASYFQTIIRSSEMYLTAAECYANLSNRDSAIFYLDEIRKRAWANAPKTTASGPALLDSIYKERRKELCFEGLRMFDIQRLKQAVNRIDAPISSAKNLPYGSNKAIAPIPTSDVNLLGISQNPGY